MSKLDKDQTIEQFTLAYTAANGKAPEIEAKGGWYSVDGGKNIRLAAIAEMTAELTGSASTTPASAPTATPAAKAKKPAAAKAKKPAAAKKTKTAKSGNGFSVKNFWQETVLAPLHNARPPR
ncbi:MAG: hypothetical protein P8J70_12155 [Glaciecola sp.]|nr:hypothetical protein [Glaciecola sp.]MDG2100413.1 hypothetical protein [Glaciecola sp.]